MVVYHSSLKNIKVNPTSETNVGTLYTVDASLFGYTQDELHDISRMKATLKFYDSENNLVDTVNSDVGCGPHSYDINRSGKFVIALVEEPSGTSFHTVSLVVGASYDDYDHLDAILDLYFESATNIKAFTKTVTGVIDKTHSISIPTPFCPVDGELTAGTINYELTFYEGSTSQSNEYSITLNRGESYEAKNDTELNTYFQTADDLLVIDNLPETSPWTSADVKATISYVYTSITPTIYGVRADKSLVKINPHIVTERLGVDWLDMDSVTIRANGTVYFARWNTFPDNVTSLASFTVNDEDGNAYFPYTKDMYISVQAFTYAKNNYTPGYENANHFEAISVHNASNNPVTIYGINLFYNRLINE